MIGTKAGADFVHLHVHSDYSLLDGCASPEAIVRAAAASGMRSVALTDHGAMHGYLPFAEAAREVGIKPIFGCELYVAPGSRHDRSEGGSVKRTSYHLTVLAASRRGYENLCILSSRGFLEGFYYRPRVDKELLRAHSEGLIVLSGCMAAEIPTLIAAGAIDKARATCKWFMETFGPDRFYLELMDHGIQGQRDINRGLLELHRELGIPIVATNDAHYLTPEDADAQDTLLCIQTGKRLDDPDRLKMESRELFLKSPAEMARAFGDLEDALRNSLEVAERCDVDLFTGELKLPRFDDRRDGDDAPARLRKAAWEGAKQRYGDPPPPDVQERLEHELKVIEATGFADYFLIVWDLVRFARERQIAVGPGRGSSASSIVAYSLGITGVDPLAHGLVFERFLNPERVTMPDIDIDFCFERRPEVIDYAAKRFGEDRVAQIATFGTLAARAAVRDAGRALSVPYAAVDKVAKAIPAGPGVTLERALDENPALRRMIDEDESLGRLLDVSLRIEGKPRHLSVHAAGIVITPDALERSVPLCKTSDGAVVTQFTGEDLERLGYLKMDILGLKTLTVIDKAIKLISKSTGRSIDLERIGLDDPAVYRQLQTGEAGGVFQLETPMFRGLLKEVRPEGFSDLVAILSLGRPGPMARLDDYLRHRRGEAAPAYPHPGMGDILDETHGIMLYQEQVMRIATELAGYTPGQADLLRRAMGKKKPEIMEHERRRFVDAAIARGLDEAMAEAVFDDVARFAEYGFPKGHSAAYAVIAYQCAYLKLYYPAAFMAARLSVAASESTEQLSRYIAVCRRMGLSILGPCVNESDVEFDVSGDAIRFGLAGIKYVGRGLAEAISVARAGGPFVSVEDFCERLSPSHLNKKALESLIRAGAFDAIADRGRALVRLDQLVRLGHGARFAKGQELLFDVPVVPETETAVPSISLEERLADELALLGAYVSAHPLDPYREALAVYAAPEAPVDGPVVVGGAVVSIDETVTRSGREMAFVGLEDIHGRRTEVVLLPQVYRKDDVAVGWVVVVKGRSEDADGAVKVVADALMKLDGVPVVVSVNSPDGLLSLKGAIESVRGGRPVVLQLDGAQVRARLVLPPGYWVAPGPGPLVSLADAGALVLEG